ncbi:MAG: S8 family serine peptidase, partial [Dehalococcoidia bacterium]|nr:S8 family serine peptidase [Dehalococcoidia bacterium]
GAVAAKPEAKAQVLIGFTQPPGPNEQALIHGVGGTIKCTYRLIPVIAAAVPESAIAGLLRNPNVTHVNPDGRVYAIQETLPWGVDRIDAEVVHAAGNKGTGVKVAIIDTGIDKDHPDLAANIQEGVNFVAKPWWASPDPDAWDDDNGHGSHVAGTVAAVDNEEGVIGVAPGAYLYGVKVLDSTGSGYWSDVIAGIDWSVDPDGDGDPSDRMDVINMSLGASSAPDDVETACIAAYDAGIVIVAAAGNNGNSDGTGDNVIYPARYASVIAVAATDSTDERASWSSTGSDVELAAPGVSIPSTWKDGGYDTKSGTSMASPHVAGTAALVISSGVVNNVDVRLQLQGTAEDLGATGWDTWYGYGLVDAEAAVGTAPDTTPPTVVSTSPVADATDVAVDTVITATFSEAMDESTITTSSFTLDSVAGSVSYDSGTYTDTFTPSANLAYSTTYTANLSTAITDAAGNPLASA